MAKKISRFVVKLGNLPYGFQRNFINIIIYCLIIKRDAYVIYLTGRFKDLNVIRWHAPIQKIYEYPRRSLIETHLPSCYNIKRLIWRRKIRSQKYFSVIQHRTSAFARKDKSSILLGKTVYTYESYSKLLFLCLTKFANRTK